ncbi:hypothetical protein O181_038505 [Austropuccinia psidii MF-1]|uniref:Uncharacterized protein n=1 Tax=Austropuccinia psidii MF-1 TaxID=1389203 RepID=A0A9Q3HE74_9BASI|nr:hypothetical protein [Austropuccinia psidii MF-1]
MATSIGAASSPQTLKCTTFDKRTTATAACNDVRGSRCSHGCTSQIVAKQCKHNNIGPDSEENCTFAFGKSTAYSYTCINEKGSYTCTGKTSGVATCKGCTFPN